MPVSILFPPSLGRARATARGAVLADSLTKRLGEPVVVQVANSYTELERRVLDNDVEMAWAPPGICAMAEPDAPAIYKAVRDGERAYHAALVGRASETPTLGTLGGTSAGWVDPLSAAGYLLPVAHLRKSGIDPEKTFRDQKYFGSYQGALLAVLSGKVDVTAVFCRKADEAAAQKSLTENVGASGSYLAPFAYTESCPHDGLIVTGAVHNSDEFCEKLAQVFSDSRRSSLLFELLDCESLERAAADDYAALRVSVD